MTTIATDGLSMAGDTLTNWSGVVTSVAIPKVFRLSDGRICGFCGPTCNYEPMRDWLEAGAAMKPETKFEDTNALIIGTDGIRVYDCDGLSTPYSPPMAIGSGMQAALVAMDLGCSPEEAVLAATKRDVHTGGLITVIHLEPKLEAVA